MITKVNLLVNNPNGILSGYVNIDPAADGNDKRVKCQLDKLGDYVDLEEVKDMMALDVLKHVSFSDINVVLDHWISRLHNGGVLTLSELEPTILCKSFFRGEIPIDKFNEIFYKNRQSFVGLTDLSNFFSHMKLKVIESKIEGARYTLKVRR